jgi:type II secretory pathway component PulF
VPEQILSYFSPSRVIRMPGVVLRILRTIGLLVACIVLAAILTRMLVLGGVLLLAGAYLVRQSRRRRGQRIISYCQEATAANLPIGPMLAVAAMDESPVMRRRLRKMAARLDAGLSLGAALELTVPEMGRELVGTIAAAERVGRLPHTLRRMWNEIIRRGRSSERSKLLVQVYAISAIVAFWVLAVFCVVVGPKFDNVIAAGYHVQVPWSARAILWLYRAAPLNYLFESIDSSGDWFPEILWGSFALVWALLLWPLMLGTFPRRRKALLEAWSDAIAWRVPVLGGLIRDRGLARALDFVADAVANGYPLDRALLEAGPAAGNHVLSRRMWTWAAGIMAGQSIEQAARAAGMPRQVVGFLAPVRGGDDLAAALRFLAGQYEYRAQRTSAIAQAMLIPMFVTIMGSLVALLGLSLFQTLADVLNAAGPYRVAGGL